jgi:hypothetical protein
LKSELEQFEEYQKERPGARRKQVKIIAELDQFFKQISPEARGEIVGEKKMTDMRRTESNRRA